MSKIDEGTDRGMSAVLKMKRSVELANDRREKLKNALARVKNHPDSAYAAGLVQSARRQAGRQSAVVKRQISRIHEMIEAAVDGDVTSLSEMVDEALCGRIDELTGKGKIWHIAKDARAKHDDAVRTGAEAKIYNAPETLKKSEKDVGTQKARLHRAISLGKSIEAKEMGDHDDAAYYKAKAKSWKGK